MNTFKDYANSHELLSLLKGRKGFLYYHDVADGKTMMVRHFNGNISPEYIPAFVDLTQVVNDWLVQHPDISEKITLQPIIEWGENYVVREFQTYQASLSRIKESNTMKKPESLGPLRQRIRELFETETIPEVVKNVITKSVLQAASKTIYDWRYDNYLILELSVNEEDLREWKENHLEKGD
jgi:hypothetical protein